MEGYEQFKQQIYRLTGIDLSSYKERQMKRRIESLIARNKMNSFESYLKAIQTNRTLLEEFINYLTINVSEFRRNPQQWDVLEQEILPDLMKGTKKIKIWSAACSTGEEPYTVVMLLTNYLPLEQISVLATDIDQKALEKASLGVYNPKAVKNLDKAMVEKFFEDRGEVYQIKEQVKKRVDFQKHNLLEDPFPRQCDLIICRNVMIYFTEETKGILYKHFRESLKPGGVLFVGSTEQIILPHQYGLQPVRTFFYQCKP